MIKIGDYNKIMEDRNIYNQIVYTPLSEALRLLEARKKDPELLAKVKKLLEGDIPDFFKNEKCGIFSRHIATPNKESERFISIAKENNLYAVFFEYYDDKFTAENEFKHSLGQLHIQKKNSKNGKSNVEKITVVDFNMYNGKKLKDVKTLWSESLIEFHKKLFDADKYKIDDLLFYNASEWFKRNGGRASEYYVNFFLLFVCYGILFENFLTYDGEGKFTKEVILPSIEKVMNLTGLKPLIVPIEPIDMELDELWISYDPKIRELIPNHKYDR